MSATAMRHLFAWLLLISPPLSAFGRAAELDRFEKSEPHMGTQFTVVLYATNQETANRGFSAAFARIGELDRRLTNYDSQSELNRLCETSAPSSPGAAPRRVQVSNDLWRVLEQANRVSEATDGGFDVTVGPLTRLWRRSRRRKQLPDPVALHRALGSVGYRNLWMHGEERSVELRLPEMKLDLGGIAKGFAADEALAALQHMGIDSALVNAGGEVVASGPPPELAGWRVGIVPVDPGEPERFLRIHHAAVATSGDAWQFVEIDGIRYSHILDPKTGLGLTKRRQATVIASDGMTADCLASALVVLGPEKGIALSDAWKDVEGLIIEVNAGRQTEHLTEGMAKCFVDREAPRKP